MSRSKSKEPLPGFLVDDSPGISSSPESVSASLPSGTADEGLPTFHSNKVVLVMSKTSLLGLIFGLLLFGIFTFSAGFFVSLYVFVPQEVRLAPQGPIQASAGEHSSNKNMTSTAARSDSAVEATLKGIVNSQVAQAQMGASSHINQPLQALGHNAPAPLQPLVQQVNVASSNVTAGAVHGAGSSMTHVLGAAPAGSLANPHGDTQGAVSIASFDPAAAAAGMPFTVQLGVFNDQASAVLEAKALKPHVSTVYVVKIIETDKKARIEKFILRAGDYASYALANDAAKNIKLTNDTQLKGKTPVAVPVGRGEEKINS